jgi:hypothetical protein
VELVVFAEVPAVDLVRYLQQSVVPTVLTDNRDRQQAA